MSSGDEAPSSEWVEHVMESSSISISNNNKKRYWRSETQRGTTSWIDPAQLHSEYYEQLHEQRKKKNNNNNKPQQQLERDGDRGSKPYYLGGYQALRRTASNATTLQPLVIEDFPMYGLLRERLLQQCLDLLAVETENNGGAWQGNSKTAKAIRKEGMRKGLQGLFGRIVWFELLEEVNQMGDVGGLERDSIFPLKFQGDAAVVKEFLEGGRTLQQASAVLSRVGAFMENACRQLLAMRNSTDLKTDVSLNAIRWEPYDVNGMKMNKLICNGGWVEISDEHFMKLLRLYRLHTDNQSTPSNPIFLRRVFCVIQRYETLSGPSDGYQMAFPNAGFQFLRDRFGVTVECFASPLNCWNQRFCSVARDTDRYFGSLGNFFKFEGRTGRVTEEDAGLEAGGSFEANPPFVEAMMDRMAERIDYLLEKYDDAPFSIIVVVPGWADCQGVIQMTNSRFNRPKPGYRLVLKQDQHDYRPGMQHRTQHVQQASHVDTFLFFLQNNKGAAKWPYREEDGEELKRMLAATSTKKQR